MIFVIGIILFVCFHIRRSFDNKVGLKKQENVEAKSYDYLPFEDNGISTTNSVDLTIIPYNGVISPMVFGGLARRDYYNEISFLGSRIVSLVFLRSILARDPAGPWAGLVEHRIRILQDQEI